MKRKISTPFFLFYHLHKFPHISLKIAFLQTRILKKLFYQTRNIAITIDIILSLLFYASILVSFYCIFLTIKYYDLPALIALLIINILFINLLRIEKKEKIINALKPFSIYNINIGSAKILRDSVVILHLFLDNSVQSWCKEKIDGVIKKSEQATIWIQKKAKYFGVDLSINHKVLLNVQVDFSKTIPESKNHYRNLEIFSKQINTILQSKAKHEILNAKHKNKNICLFIHVFEEIRSYAVPNLLGIGYETIIPEYCVIAFDSQPSTYAHELLHLFGADDYYSDYSENLTILKSDLISRSIMFSDGAFPLEMLTIDDLTAQNIGWL